MNAELLLEKTTQLQSKNLLLQNEKQTLESDLLATKSQLLAANSQIEWLKRQIFGKRSEKVISKEDQDQLLFEGFEIEDTQKEKENPVKGHVRKKTGKDAITLPADLPIEKQVIDIPEKEKICPNSQKPLQKIGEEVTSKLAHKPGSYYIKQIIRPKYATPEGSIKTALLPESLLDRCQADESLLAHVIVQKYIDHLPLYRISEILKRGDIKISRQTVYMVSLL